MVRPNVNGGSTTLQQKQSRALSLLFELNVEQLSTDLEERVWRGEILETDAEFLQGTNECLRDGLLEDLVQAFHELVKSESSNNFWNYASERDFASNRQRSLLVWLYGLLVEKSVKSFTAAKLYALLMICSGGGGGGDQQQNQPQSQLLTPLFHPFIFRAFVNVFKFWKLAQQAGGSTDSCDCACTTHTTHAHTIAPHAHFDY